MSKSKTSEKGVFKVCISDFYIIFRGVTCALCIVMPNLCLRVYLEYIFGGAKKMNYNFIFFELIKGFLLLVWGVSDIVAR